MMNMVAYNLYIIEYSTLMSASKSGKLSKTICIDLSILVIVLYYSFARYPGWGKLGNVYRGLVYIVSYNQLHVNLQLSQIFSKKLLE